MNVRQILEMIAERAPKDVEPDGFPLWQGDDASPIQRSLRGVLEGEETARAWLSEVSAEDRVVWRAVCVRLAWVSGHSFWRRTERVQRLCEVLDRLAARQPEATPEELGATLEDVSLMRIEDLEMLPWGTLLRYIEDHMGAHGRKEAYAEGLRALRVSATLVPMGERVLERLQALCEGRHEAHFEVGAAWTQAAQAELEEMSMEQREPWDALLGVWSTATLKHSTR